MPKGQYVTVVLPAEVDAELRQIAEKEDRSLGYLVRQAVKAWLEARRQQEKTR